MSDERVAGLAAEASADLVRFRERGVLLAIAEVRSAESELCAPLAERVVRAVNAHDALVEALRDLRLACEDAYKSGRIPAEPFVRAGNVLRLAEGGQS